MTSTGDDPMLAASSLLGDGPDCARAGVSCVRAMAAEVAGPISDGPGWGRERIISLPRATVQTAASAISPVMKRASRLLTYWTWKLALAVPVTLPSVALALTA